MYKLVTDATTPVVTVTDAKKHLRVTDNESNSTIESLVAAATKFVQNKTRRQLINATYRVSMRQFPMGGGVIELPRSPASSVTSIAYIDENGVSQTWSSSNYILDSDSEPGRITEAYEQNYPSTRIQDGGVLITYVAGYGAASTDVPDDLIHAVKLILGHWFENREAVITGTISSAISLAVDAILSQYEMPKVHWS